MRRRGDAPAARLYQVVGARLQGRPDGEGMISLMALPVKWGRMVTNAFVSLGTGGTRFANGMGDWVVGVHNSGGETDVLCGRDYRAKATGMVVILD